MTTAPNEEPALSADETTLYSVIDKINVHGLNLTVPETAQSVIKPWHERDDTEKYTESNVDDQMILHVPFTQNVRLKSICLKLGRGELAPRNLRLYINKPHILDFDDIESGAIPAQLDIALLENEMGVTEYPLRVAAFASVNSLSVFFGDSAGAETVRVYYLGFKGDIRAPKKEAGAMLDIKAENAADAALIDRVKERSGAAQDVAR